MKVNKEVIDLLKDPKHHWIDINIDFYDELEWLLEFFSKNSSGLTKGFVKYQSHYLDFEEVWDFAIQLSLIKEEGLYKITIKGREFLRELRRENISKKQVEILEKQSEFNKTLAMATTILAIAAFLQILFYIISKDFTLGFKTATAAIATVFLLIAGVYLFGIMAKQLFYVIFPKRMENVDTLIRNLLRRRNLR